MPARLPVRACRRSLRCLSISWVFNSLLACALCPAMSCPCRCTVCPCHDCDCLAVVLPVALRVLSHVRVHLLVLSVLCIVCCVHVVLCPRLAFACVTVIALILHLSSYVIFPCVFGRPLPCFAFHDPSCGECHFCLLACPCPTLHAMALPVLSGPGLA